MQRYTGLVDCNRRPMFEGDLITCECWKHEKHMVGIDKGKPIIGAWAGDYRFPPVPVGRLTQRFIDDYQIYIMEAK